MMSIWAFAEKVIPTVLLALAGSPDPAVLGDVMRYGIWRSLGSDGGFWDSLDPGILLVRLGGSSSARCGLPGTLCVRHPGAGWGDFGSGEAELAFSPFLL